MNCWRERGRGRRFLGMPFVEVTRDHQEDAVVVVLEALTGKLVHCSCLSA